MIFLIQLVLIFLTRIERDTNLKNRRNRGNVLLLYLNHKHYTLVPITRFYFMPCIIVQPSATTRSALVFNNKRSVQRPSSNRCVLQNRQLDYEQPQITHWSVHWFSVFINQALILCSYVYSTVQFSFSLTSGTNAPTHMAQAIYEVKLGLTCLRVTSLHHTTCQFYASISQPNSVNIKI